MESDVPESTEQGHLSNKERGSKDAAGVVVVVAAVVVKTVATAAEKKR